MIWACWPLCDQINTVINSIAVQHQPAGQLQVNDRDERNAQCCTQKGVLKALISLIKIGFIAHPVCDLSFQRSMNLNDNLNIKIQKHPGIHHSAFLYLCNLADIESSTDFMLSRELRQSLK